MEWIKKGGYGGDFRVRGTGLLAGCKKDSHPRGQRAIGQEAERGSTENSASRGHPDTLDIEPGSACGQPRLHLTSRAIVRRAKEKSARGAPARAREAMARPRAFTCAGRGRGAACEAGKAAGTWHPPAQAFTVKYFAEGRHGTASTSETGKGPGRRTQQRSL